MSTAGPGETPDLFTIGELARWAGVALATLRHYEDLGLLASAEPGAEARAAAGDPALYPPSTVGRVEVIRMLDAVGFTPRETRELLDARSGSPRSWRQLTERKVAALDRQIRAATTARDALDHALRCEHDGIVDCPRFRALVADHHDGGEDLEPGPDREPEPDGFEQPATVDPFPP